MIALLTTEPDLTDEVHYASLESWAEAIATRIADEAEDLYGYIMRGNTTQAVSAAYLATLNGALEGGLSRLMNEEKRAENARILADYLKSHPRLIEPMIGSAVIEEEHFTDLMRGDGEPSDEPAWMDGDALASAGFGTDEDYGGYGGGDDF